MQKDRERERETEINLEYIFSTCSVLYDVDLWCGCLATEWSHDENVYKQKEKKSKTDTYKSMEPLHRKKNKNKIVFICS